MLTRLAAAIALLALTTTVALAQTSNRVAVFQDWAVYSGTGNRICYAASQPTRSLPQGASRDPAFFMIANYPDRSVTNEAFILMGYPLEANSMVTVVIDNTHTFSFFTGQDGAWLQQLDQEEQLISAMRSGITMEVRGRSARGTDTTDTYSLRGVTAAIERAGTECR